MAKCVLTRIFAGKLDGRVTHMCDALAVLLVAQVHAVRVSVAAPSHGNTQAIHSALELVCVAPAGRPRGCVKTETGAQLQCNRVNIYTKARTRILLFDGNECLAS